MHLSSSNLKTKQDKTSHRSGNWKCILKYYSRINSGNKRFETSAYLKKN